MGEHCVCCTSFTKRNKTCSGEKCNAKLLHKCRRLVGHFKHSALATNGLEQKQKALGFTSIRHVIQEVSTRWNSTFHMVQRLVQLKQPIRLYLEDTLSDRDIASFDLSDVEWGITKKF